MAFSDCIDTIRKSAPSLTDEEAQDLLEQVSTIVEQKRADARVDDLQGAVREAVSRMAEDAERAALIEKRNAALRVQTRLRQRGKIDALIRSGQTDRVGEYLESITVGIPGDSQFKESIERSARSLEAQAHALFESELRKKGTDTKEAIKFLRTKESTRLLIMEADNPGASGVKIAKDTAEAMEATQEYLRVRANEYGADIGKLPGYLVKQGHDGDKLTMAGKDEWIDFILPLLDHDRTFGTADKREFLGKAYENIILGKPADLVKDLSAPPGFKGPGNMGKRLSQKRVLHFKKDGESAYVYLQRFGQKEAGSSFAFGVDGMSRAIAAMIHLGPNPEYMLRELIDYAGNSMRESPRAVNALQSEATHVMRLYDEVSGKAGRLPSALEFGGKLARGTNWAKNITGSALLGGASIAALADAGTAAARLADIGVPFLEAHASVLSGLKRGRGEGETKRIANSLGVGLEGLITDVQSRWMGNDGASGQGSFLVGTVMRVTGMNWLTDSFKTAAALSLSNYIAKVSDVNFDALSPQLKREMEAYGIDANQWESIRNASTEVDGKAYIDPDGIQDETSLRKFREFMVGFVDSAVLTPGARTSSLMRLRGGERGSVLTEIAVLFTHLKSFSVTYFQEHLSRFYRQGDGIRFGYAAHLTLSALVYGYLASSIKDIFAGREPRDPANPATWADAWLTGGGAGFYGDLVFALLDDKKIPGKGILENTAGPALGLVFRGADVASDLVEGDTRGAAVGVNRIAKTVIPGSNIFYTRWVTDYMIWWPMAEYIRPGFARRVEKRAKEDRGHEYLPNMGPIAATR